MPIGLILDRRRIREIHAAIAAGEPIPGPWTTADLYMMAGVCRYVRLATAIYGGRPDVETLGHEHREHVVQSIEADAEMAEQVVTVLVQKALGTEPEPVLDEDVGLLVWADADGNPAMRKVAGVKGVS